MEFYKQHDQMDCGPTCLRMVANFHGRNFSIQNLRELCQIDKEGVSLLGISKAAEKIGLRTLGAKISLLQLKSAELPCILHWRQNHFVVLYKIKKGYYYIADPAVGFIKLNENEFCENWVFTKDFFGGISLLLSPTPEFYELQDNGKSTLSWSYIVQYLRVYKQLIIQLVLGLGIVSLLQLISPFLTQALVDIGIYTGNITFIYLILIAQLTLFFGSASIEFIRSWILLHITTRVNIAILSDFLIKLMKLPISFFDSKMTGDIMQRMEDQDRIQNFLTGSTLSIIFSFFNLVIFAFVLAHYDSRIFLIFLAGSILYSCWILIFLKRRRNLDYKRFAIASANQSNTIQLITGMQEIKMSNSEKQQRWQWEHLQASYFKFNVKSLALSQYQSAGAIFINQSKNILITFCSVKAVVDGNITLGAMMAVQYIVGQLNSPIEQFMNFIRNYQDAKISMERLNEIHQIEDEEGTDKQWNYEIPPIKTIDIQKLTFTYPGAGNDPVLKNIDLKIEEGKTTAIVGMSGSGKTTILKILLRFYDWQKGSINVGGNNLSEISHQIWRKHCGFVMQDGYIFSDTIANNIAIGDEYPNILKIEHAAKVANLDEFISTLPNGFNTKIGSEGNGISQGQKQRILIARAVYKDPEYMFFDEATNSLDANNERAIMNNLQEFLKGRTVVVVAHRLSTVCNADHIVVLNKGMIIEQGTHFQLVNLKGEYYNLVKNQLELGL